jgi:ppGpp synthetase/RelA/SpoT-type nucleotidyltranferase
MQDIAGCRLVTENVIEQDATAFRLELEFPGARMLDRRARPSFGYRAVHVIVPIFGKFVEVQIRTLLQDRWAQCSEELAFTIDPAIKYGGGPPEIAALLLSASSWIEAVENRFAAKTELDVLRIASDKALGEEVPLAGQSFEEMSLSILDGLQQLVTMSQRIHPGSRSRDDLSD